MRFGFGQVGLGVGRLVYLELLVCGLALDESVWELVSWCIWWRCLLLVRRKEVLLSVGQFGAIGLTQGTVLVCQNGSCWCEIGVVGILGEFWCVLLELVPL